MMREKLGSERMGSPVFIEKASADERMNGCRAGCLHARRPLLEAAAHVAFFVSRQVTLPTPGCVSPLY